MVRVILSELARCDLLDARSYIENDLQNTVAARKVVAKIFKSMRTLERFPYAGTPLQVSGLDTDYRVLTSGNYRIFYLCDEKIVRIVRVLSGRRDFMRVLFGVTEDNQ
mgnify:CR=1 FL=1